MFMSVDLPAPFSPTMPWIVPRGICRSTFLLAWTGPKRLSMPLSSTAGSAFAADDLLLRLLEPGLHLRSDEVAVVPIQRVADAVFGEAQVLRTGRQVALHGVLEGIVHRDVDPLEHRGQHAARMQVVLVAVDPDRQL